MKAQDLLLLLLVTVLVFGNVAGQSLKSDAPDALQPGINKGTADSLVGTQYWYFYATPGNSRVSVRFKTPTTLYGTELKNNAITFTLYDERRTWKNTKVVTSRPNSSEAAFTAEKVQKRMKIIIMVSPPAQNLVRMGGDYEIEATGDVAFDAPKATTDPIVRTYQPKTGISGDDLGSVRFKPDGTIETANGFKGTWKLFDPDDRIYTVEVGRFRVSVKYRPGYGLVKPDDQNLIIFQEVRR